MPPIPFHQRRRHHHACDVLRSEVISIFSCSSFLFSPLSSPFRLLLLFSSCRYAACVSSTVEEWRISHEREREAAQKTFFYIELNHSFPFRSLRSIFRIFLYLFHFRRLILLVEQEKCGEVRESEKKGQRRNRKEIESYNALLKSENKKHWKRMWGGSRGYEKIQCNAACVHVRGRTIVFVRLRRHSHGRCKYDIEASKNNLMRFKIEILSRSDEKSR